MAGGMVTSGILFAINTTGGAKAKLAFAAVAVGLVLVVKKLFAAQQEAEKFAQAWGHLDAEQRKAVQSMDDASKGLADTKASIQAVTSITEANLEATPKLMAAITKLSVDMSKKLGEGPEGVTRRIQRLSEAIKKGQGEALQDYGIKIIDTSDLLSGQEEAMRKVQERAEGLTITLDTLGEQQFALNNNLETFQGLFLGTASPVGFIQAFNEGLNLMNDSMMDAGDGSMDVMLSMDGMGLAIGSATLDMFGMTETADILSDRLDRLIGRASAVRKAAALQADIRSEDKWIADNPQVVLELLKLSEGDPEFFNAAVAQARDIQTKEAREARRRSLAGRVKPGGAKAAAAAPKLEGEAAWQDELDAAERSKQIAFDKHIWLIENNQEYHDKIEQQQIDADAELGQQQWDAAMSRQDAEMEMIELSQETKWALQLGADEAAEAQAEQHHNWLLAHSEQYAKKQAEIDKAAALARLGQFKGMFTNLSSLMQLENKKAFYIGKAAAYAATVINTAEAAMASFKAMAGIPYVGPALGAVAAATAITAGAVQLATIKKQKYGDAGGGVSAGAVGTTGGGYLGGGGNYAAGGAGAGQTMQVTVILGEEEFHGWSIKANQQASQKGDPAFAEEAA